MSFLTPRQAFPSLVIVDMVLAPFSLLQFPPPQVLKREGSHPFALRGEPGIVREKY